MKMRRRELHILQHNENGREEVKMVIKEGRQRKKRNSNKGRKGVLNTKITDTC